MEIVELIFLLLAWITVVSFLVSGLDDLFFDTQFLVYLFKNRKKRPLDIEQLNLVPEQWIAIFVPAWQEGGIVNRMAEYASRVLLYEKYDIFIGVYPNDPPTIECVDRACADNPRLHKVVVPHPGPTSKADCLNWIYRAMKLNEIPGTRTYRIMAIHDAEDILHPLTLKVYNYFVPSTYDMAQLPVFALEHSPWRGWTANTYVDDFSELHTKDLFVRESIGGVVPSAGVGTCFSQRVLDQLATSNHGDPFLLGNLTEDYEIGIRIKRAGFRTGVIHYPVERIVRRRKRDGELAPPRAVQEVVAVREAFPSSFRAAVRQRTRWILGISFQTWEQAGWAGTLPMRYTLLRDRRAPLTHLINMAGYVTLAGVMAQWIFGLSPWSQYMYWRPIFRPDSILWTLVILCTWLLIYRAAQKFISVWHIYSLPQAFFSLPRTVVNNLINFAATLRALGIYVRHKFTKQEIAWHKTTHVFPEDAALGEYNKSIEDLLVEQGIATQEELFRAIEAQGGGSAPDCLLRMGLIREEQFTEIWSKFSGLTSRPLTPADVPLPPLHKFSEQLSLEVQALPVEMTNQAIVLAFREPPDRSRLERLSHLFAQPVQAVLSRPSEIEYCRDRVYPKLLLPGRPEDDWSQRLLSSSKSTPGHILEIVREHQASLLSLEDILINRGFLELSEARRQWASHLHQPAYAGSKPVLDYETYTAIGPAFWWLHRMLPLQDNVILIGAPPHARLVEWLRSKLGRTPRFEAELASTLDRWSIELKAAFDPDQALLDTLTSHKLLREEDRAEITAARKLVQDPIANWLRLHRRVTESQMHEIFLEISGLPPAEAPEKVEVARIAPLLPPGFAVRHGCYPLRVADGVVLGLSQLPDPTALKRLYRRLNGHPVFFQALPWSDLKRLRELSSASPRP